VNYRGGITLRRCGLSLSIRDTDVTDDLPRSLRDRVEGYLWEVDLAAVREVRLTAKIAYLGFSPLRDNLTEIFDVLVFVAGPSTNGLGVGDLAKVLMQAPLEKVDVPDFEASEPFFHELDLWRNGHCDEATGGEVIFLRTQREAQGHLLYTHQDIGSNGSRGAQLLSNDSSSSAASPVSGVIVISR